MIILIFFKSQKPNSQQELIWYFTVNKIGSYSACSQLGCMMFACGIMFWTRRKVEKKQRKGKPLLYRSQVSLSASIGYKKTAV